MMMNLNNVKSFNLYLECLTSIDNGIKPNFEEYIKQLAVNKYDSSDKSKTFDEIHEIKKSNNLFDSLIKMKN